MTTLVIINGTASAIDWSSMFQSIQTQAIEGITAMLPIAVSIFGVMVAVSLGVKVYRRLAGR